MQILGRPGRPGLGAYEPCRDITPPTMIRLTDVRGKLQSSFTVTCSRFRPIIIVFDTSAFSGYPELFMHNACCTATSARTRPPNNFVTSTTTSYCSTVKCFENATQSIMSCSTALLSWSRTYHLPSTPLPGLHSTPTMPVSMPAAARSPCSQEHS